MNSARAEASRIQPPIEEVTMEEFCFPTPLEHMQKCFASITTMDPFGVRC